jgi:hypothetical protein
MNVDMDAIKAFFFEAMQEGWVNPESHAEPVAGMPGWKGYEYRKGNLYLRDVFTVNWETGKSAGCTTIFQECEPVWIMFYSGMYPKDAIPTVKQALASAYKEHSFLGGRGVKNFQTEESSFLYLNWVEKIDFTDFCGHETVINPSTHGFPGYHNYYGMSLV